MTSAEIDQIVAQRVTDAIEAISVYEAIRMAHDSMNQVKPDVSRAYTIRANERKAYAGNLPYCNKCMLHHVGPCNVKCSKCKRVGHITRDCKASVAAMNQRAHVENPKATITCYECGRDIIPLAERPNLVPGSHDNYKLSIYSRTEKTFDGPEVKAKDAIIAIELDSFDVIIGMDWLANHLAMIVCNEKIVRIPYGDEVLIVQGDSGAKGEKSKLSIISCTKTQKVWEEDIPKIAFRTRYSHYEFQSEKEKAAFQLLKRKLCSAPILALTEGSENFVVYCDASRKGLGAVLMQKGREARLTGSEIVHETTEKIIQIMKHIQVARDRQKRCADRRKQLSRVHSTFHVSNLKKCFVDEPLTISFDEIQIDDKFNFIEEPVEIIDREVKWINQSRIPIVKVRWNSRRGSEFTYEREDQMKKKYPHLFVNPLSTP
uniref:Putative reverse transcriptase domain-containing protein n=1 Tax=Tanacetum cinerariifolium TaxID=118510 RepID=A0A6L2L258_TANCI|nr:putative reverse transcriptase domain-containing protein [Tanacetum cinerariifolium]